MDVDSDIHKFIIEEEIEIENIENENVITISSGSSAKSNELSKNAASTESVSLSVVNIENVPFCNSSINVRKPKSRKTYVKRKENTASAERKTTENSIFLRNNNIKITNPVLDGKYFYVKRSYQIIKKRCKMNNFISDIKNKVDVICQNCNAKLTVAVDNCSNLYRHMQRYHSGVVTEFIDYVNGRKKKSKLHLLQTKTLEHIITYITTNMLPLSTVDEPTFKDLFAPYGVKVFSRKVLYEKLKRRFEEYKANLIQMLSNVNHVCLTADIWSSKTRSFLGTTIHWLDKEMNRVSYVLDICRVTEKYDYIKLNELLEDISYKFDLNYNKVNTVLTDNSYNFVKYFKEIGVNENAVLFEPEAETSDCEEYDFEDIEESKYDLDFNFEKIENNDSERQNDCMLPFHIRSVSHMLHLLCTADFIEILNNNLLLRNIHESMIYKCNQLWLASRQPKTAKIIQHVLKKKLLYSNISNWKSLFDSLKVITTVEYNLNILCDTLNLTQTSLTYEPLRNREKNYLNAYLNVMEPIFTALDQLQQQKNMYYGSFLPTIFIIQMKLVDVVNNTDTQKDNIKKFLSVAVLQSFKKRFSKFLSLDLKDADVHFAVLATLSHPRFKIKWFEFLDDEVLTKMKALFIAETKKILKWNTVSKMRVVKNEHTSADDYFDINSLQFMSIPENSYENGCEEKVELEIYRFFEDRDTDFKILNRYQFVTHIFIRFNTPLPTSAPIEQLFSFEKIMNANRHNNLNDKLFVLLLFLKANRHMQDCK